MQGKKSISFPWGELLNWYEVHGRHHLPWRQYDAEFKIQNSKFKGDEDKLKDTLSGIGNLESGIYKIWLSEILLQQTQVDRVIPYLEKILVRYPTIHHLAGASYDEFFPYYQGMGYYSRARNILKTAKIISEEYAGIFPIDKNLLQKLPGVGGYTSSAILAFGYGEPYLAWDTNLEKVFARYYNGRKDMKLTEEQKEKIEEKFREYIKNRDGKIDDMSEMGVRGEGTVGTKMRSIGNDEQGEEEGVGLPLETFDTFGHKSTENRVGKEITGLLHASQGLEQSEGQKALVRAINNALMDFAATVDLKNPDNIDWRSYPIKNGLFYETRGSLEPREEKKSRTFPIPDATVIVILHQDHRDYYIPHYSDTYTPFVLTPALHRDTRLYVQEYFRRFHFLELSVRPVHAKWLTEDGRAYIAVNAQIQAGDRQQFKKTDKKTAQEVLKKMIP